MVVNYSPSSGEVETESLAWRAPNLTRDPDSKTNVEKKKIASDDLWTSGLLMDTQKHADSHTHT